MKLLVFLAKGFERLSLVLYRCYGMGKDGF